jgi:hypothetical protein
MIKFQEFIDQITLLNNAEDLVILGKEAGVIRTDFEDYLLHQEGQAQILKIEAKEKGEVFEALDFQAIKESFYLIYNQFQERRKQQVALKTTLENENFKNFGIVKKEHNLIVELYMLLNSENEQGSIWIYHVNEPGNANFSDINYLPIKRMFKIGSIFTN